MCGADCVETGAAAGTRATRGVWRGLPHWRVPYGARGMAALPFCTFLRCIQALLVHKLGVQTLQWKLPPWHSMPTEKETCALQLRFHLYACQFSQCRNAQHFYVMNPAKCCIAHLANAAASAFSAEGWQTGPFMPSELQAQPGPGL